MRPPLIQHARRHLRAQHCRKPPATSRHRLRLLPDESRPQHRCRSRPVAGSAFTPAGRTAIDAGSTSSACSPRPRYRLPASINSPTPLSAPPRTSQFTFPPSPELSTAATSAASACSSSPPVVPPQATSARGEDMNESPSTSSLCSPTSRLQSCPGEPPATTARSPLTAPSSVSVVSRGRKWTFCP
jgi:hypothetical protein